MRVPNSDQGGLRLVSSASLNFSKFSAIWAMFGVVEPSGGVGKYKLRAERRLVTTKTVSLKTLGPIACVFLRSLLRRVVAATPRHCLATRSRETPLLSHSPLAPLSYGPSLIVSNIFLALPVTKKILVSIGLGRGTGHYDSKGPASRPARLNADPTLSVGGGDTVVCAKPGPPRFSKPPLLE